MSGCWQEGEWRAWIDGELPPGDMAAGREHLLECRACANLQAELASRASRVGIWMADLDRTPVPIRRKRPSGISWQWAAGIALAAALAAAFILSSRQVEVVQAPTVAAQPAAARPMEQTPLRAAAVSVQPVRPARTARRKTPQVQFFVALDEEPIDTGTVMRVTLDSGIEADLIVDAGGRPRAIRPISAIR